MSVTSFRAAAEYRDRAREASAFAADSGLDRVRERHEAAAARWNVLAGLMERGAKLRRARAAKRADEPALGLSFEAADIPQRQEPEHGQGSEEIEPRNP